MLTIKKHTWTGNTVVRFMLNTSAKKVTFSARFVCLPAELRKNCWPDCHYILWKDVAWAKEEFNFEVDLNHGADTQITFHLR